MDTSEDCSDQPPPAVSSSSSPSEQVIKLSTATPDTSLSPEKKSWSTRELAEIIDLTGDLDDYDIEKASSPSLTNTKVKEEPEEEVVEVPQAKSSGSSRHPSSNLPNLSGVDDDLLLSNDSTQQHVAESSEQDQIRGGETFPGEVSASRDESFVADEDMAKMLSTFMENQQSDQIRKQSVLGYQEEAVLDGSSEEEDAEHTVSFLDLKKRYEAKEAAGTLTLEEEVEFNQAKEEEARRNKILLRKRAYQEMKESIFIPESIPEEDQDLIELPAAPAYSEAVERPKKKPRSSGYGPRNSNSNHHTSVISDSEEEPIPRQRSGRLGRGGRAGARTTASKSKSTKPRERKGGKAASQKAGSRASGAKKSGPTMLPSLLQNNIVANAQRNQGREQQPGFTTKNKAKALNELISSVPEAHRRPHAETKKELDAACKTFASHGKGSMRADGSGGWRLKGMNTSLYHYQLLGAGWMRKRELGLSPPFGGLLADSMGYGKTIMTICNIVDGCPKAGAKNRTTLVVCPSSLCNQWLDEFKTHVELKALGEVMVYRSGSRVQSSDPIKTLTNCSVVITTYHEVMRNYPKCEPPKHLVLEERRQQWWSEHYAANKGPLLQIAWHRVVLDEGHLIKNHEGRTSMACQQLTAKYRWILSGTPLQNRLEELGPFLMFLKAEGAANFQQFKENYCKNNEKCLERVEAVLRTIMKRRTGSDEMFGRPILSLPSLRHETIVIEFNETEKAIYLMLRARFIERINQWSVGGTLQKNHRNLLVMLVRLRQMCAHILIVVPTLKDLLATEDLEKLWKLTDQETLPTSDNDANPGTVTVFRKMLAQTRATPDPNEANEPSRASSTNKTEVPNQDSATAEEPNTFTGMGALGGGKFKFRKYLRKLYEDGSWAEISARSNCHRCHEPPENPRLTRPCAHLYCEECLRAMQNDATRDEVTRPMICFECSNPIEGSEKLRATDEVSADLDDPTAIRQTKKRRASTDSGQSDREQSWIDAPGAPLLSSKVQAVTSTIMGWLAKDSSTKIIIFSLFKPMIRVFEKICQRQGWGCCLYTGDLNQDQRHISLTDFKEKPDKQILLASMKAGGLGLNLTMANKCCVVDPWWNESVEDQAWSRIFRIGQSKDVEVKRFMVKDSIDTQLMLKLQEKKTQEISRVIGDGRSNKAMTARDLMELFGPVQIDPSTGAPQVSEEEDAVGEFVFAEDQIIQEDSDADVPEVAPRQPW